MIHLIIQYTFGRINSVANLAFLNQIIQLLSERHVTVDDFLCDQHTAAIVYIMGRHAFSHCGPVSA